MNVRHPMGVLHSFAIKNMFYDIMDSRLFYFDVAMLSLLSYFTHAIIIKTENSIFNQKELKQ